MNKFLMIFSVLILSILVACDNDSTSGNDTITVEEVITAFQDAGLEAENATEMTKDDYGMAPMKDDEAKRFLTPSIGEGAGGRILSYSNQDDLEEMKAYYDDLGRESAMFFSWTIAHKNILVQINGDLPEEEYNKYKEALEAL
ncbi:stress protein [Gracilibacillus oryzae]|uniref:Stress protein n=1 Tax=Gracilibacillus oryzae TaxID=1672701 RepID=A0A7C8L626_9BACI|nr:stress protein [Gracilibacillus oryzae]KAB8139076.1 stress protein [Gracilibacillus oryzae]